MLLIRLEFKILLRKLGINLGGIRAHQEDMMILSEMYRSNKAAMQQTIGSLEGGEN